MLVFGFAWAVGEASQVCSFEVALNRKSKAGPIR